MLKKLWHDPVWSNVIATIVVGIPATIAYFLNWWPWILHWLAAPVRFLGRTSVIPNWLVALLILLAIPTIGVPPESEYHRSRIEGEILLGCCVSAS